MGLGFVCVDKLLYVSYLFFASPIIPVMSFRIRDKILMMVMVRVYRAMIHMEMLSKLMLRSQSRLLRS